MGDDLGHRQLYLFYASNSTATTPETVPEAILYDDDSQDEQPCRFCLSATVIEEDNVMFICDGCDQAIHQQCASPPIEEWEKEINPWFCIDCRLAPKGVKRKRE